MMQDQQDDMMLMPFDFLGDRGNTIAYLLKSLSASKDDSKEYTLGLEYLKFFIKDTKEVHKRATEAVQKDSQGVFEFPKEVH